MPKRIKPRDSLIFSALCMVISLSLIVGSTFAWFNDNISTGSNVIKAGNLDVLLKYKNSDVTEYTEVTPNTHVFKSGLWEPGQVRWVHMKVANEGSLALKYQLDISYKETPGKNVYEDEFDLSEAIEYVVLDGEVSIDSREEAIAAMGVTPKSLSSMQNNVDTLHKNECMLVNTTETFTLILCMPKDISNEYNPASEADAPTLDLYINLVATQTSAESDSFGADYDATVPMTEPSVPETSEPETDDTTESESGVSTESESTGETQENQNSEGG